MTYVSKGDKIFGMCHGIFAECSPPTAKRSDGRLKRFSSIFDDRIWSLNDKQRYRYLYETMGGSRTCLTVSTCFQYVPLEEIISIFLADRDAYIKCLEKKLGLGVSKEEMPIDELFKACHFEDEEELDVISMKNKIGALTAELEECRNTRDTLRQAMHKLENIDEIINENECLKRKLRCSEEIIKYLEEKKSKLEKELENIRTKSQIQIDLENAKETLKKTIQREQLAEGEDLVLLARERDNLQQRVCELQHELNDARSKQSELELFKKQSQSTSLSLEEITKENECYKKKLASMTCLEKQIQELKKRANVLAEKYKRDACRASDQDRKMKNISSELQSLREERDRLRRRVDELACYEYQYNSFQCKLQRLDSIIAENEMLNCKLASLDKLEIENQYLRCKLEQCQSSELEAAESREKIIELQNAVADQEEEMKDLLCQIEKLTRAFGSNDELDCLKEQLSEKDCKLKLCEEQLAEIPLLEAEIDELRSKLENCCNNIGEQVKKANEPQKSEVDEESPGSNENLEIVGTRYEEEVEMEPAVYQEIRGNEAFVLEKTDGEKGSMSCEEIQTLLQSSKGIINCVLEDMIEHQREMEELEKCNQEMRNEICLLKAKMGKTDMDECLQQLEKLRRVIEEKELKICCLETQILRCGDVGKVNDHINNLECEIECLKDLNKKMRIDLEEACCEIKRCADLESLVEQERQTRKDLANQLESRKSTKSQKEEFNLEAKVSSAASINECDALKSEVKELKQLVEELKKENSALKEMQTTCPDYLREMDEKEALENLLNLLQCELDSCRQEKVGNDCEDLKLELSRLEDQNCQLKNLVNCYKERLDLERSSKEQTGSSGCLQEENKKLRSEITRLRCELMELCKRIQQNEKTICEQENEIEKLKQCCNDLVSKNDELEAELDEKDNESQNLKGEVSKLLDQTYKLSSDNDVLKNRLNEAKAPHSEVQAEDYEKDLNEKHALESAMRNLEEEVDGLKMKLEECGKVELEKNNLLKKQTDMEAEMEILRKQLSECKGDVKLSEKSESKPAPPLSATPPPPTYLAETKTAILSSESKALAEAKEKEDKLIEEKERLNEQTNKLQAEVYEAKAENKKLKNEVDELKKLLDQCNKEKAYEPENQKLKNEVDELRKLLDQCNKEKAYEPENKKLKNEVDDLKKLLDQCNKEKAHEAAQASLMSSKLQGISYPVPAQAQGIPQTVIPIKEEQRTSVYERGRPSEIAQGMPGGKVAFIENQAPQTLVKVVAEAEDFKKPKEGKPKPDVTVKTKTNENVPVKEAGLKSSKTGVMPLAKALSVTPSKEVAVSAKAPAAIPSKPTIETPSKAAVLTPSRLAANVITTESKILKDDPTEAVAPNAKKGKTGELTSVSDESVISFSDIDTDFAKFLCSLNPDNHKQNICEIERRYKEKMCELQRKHDEKMKKLVEQHEKESKLRDGIYNDNVSTMRSNYETDIRKLVERHKASILRLQSLHEDEIQQLNVNYEAEIEAIETQNDNMLNDLTAGAREKFKMLAEHHNKEMKELEGKYRELLGRKENEHVAELSKLKSNMSEKIDRVEEYHTRTVSDMTMALEGNISDIQTRHNREFQKLKKSNLRRIDILKNKYEGLLMCERKKYEKQLEDMVQRLRQGKALADGICQCRFTVMCDSKDPDAPLEFNDVIQKILAQGLESLTFNEVALVHKRTCAATEDILLKSEIKAELQPSIKDDSCERNQLVKVNKEEMLSKILVLENEIAVKQRETQDAIVNMEIAVKAERKRLQDLRDFLRSEHGKSSDVVLSKPKIERDIKSAIDLQCMLVRENSAMQKMDRIEKERRPLPLVPEKENAKNLHMREPQSEARKRKSHSDGCKPKHGGTTKKKLKQ